jgi:uncharacterized protein YuzE
MRITYDKLANIQYIYLKDKIRKGEVAKTVEITDGVLFDYSKSGELLGIEIIGISSKLTNITSNKQKTHTA